MRDNERRLSIAAVKNILEGGVWDGAYEEINNLAVTCLALDEDAQRLCARIAELEEQKGCAAEECLAAINAWAELQMSVAAAKRAEDAPCSAGEHEYAAERVRWIVANLRGVLGLGNGPPVSAEQSLLTALEYERMANAKLRAQLEAHGVSPT